MRWRFRPLALLLIMAVTLATPSLALAETGQRPTAQSGQTTHVVQAGETLFIISQIYGVSWTSIAAANGIVGDRIFAGQTLVIPDPNAPAPAAPVNNASNPVHIVQAGETLFTIGLEYGIVWTKIAAANGISGDIVYVGQRLVIPVNGTAAPAEAAPTPVPAEATPVPADPTAAPAPAEGQRSHVVQRGETLALIANQYGVTWPAIMAANNLASDVIYSGQTLIIPAAGEYSDAVAPANNVGVNKQPVAGRSDKYFLVDLSDQRLYAFEGQTLVRQTIVSTGRWPTPTVIGEFKIWIKLESTRMTGPGYDLPNVPYTMYFYQGYGIHGTYWHNNFGTPMSHGCVNLPTPEAQWAFYWADVGTTVIVTP
ncbi:MAG: LysM peptidoglycan-binding domain-containing protein [Anaerolineales bacterium]|nr:LysM peptidoglycan-binding domain-containing protein [Anaerolineales bacterium]